MTISKTNKRSESGNVLFLILIAVALFAALSYVVTQSTRSGGGSTEREKNVLSSAQMTQYPTALRTAIIRMVLGGVAVENIAFNTPATFGSVSVSRLVFHPQGGGATFQEAPADLSATGAAPLTWYYNIHTRITNIGTDTDSTGNDMIAFLPGVSAGICKQANTQLGNLVASTCTVNQHSGVPDVVAGITSAIYQANMTDTYVIPPSGAIAIDGQGCTAGIFDRHASGCFYDTAGAANRQYVFYSVLLER